MAVDQETEWDDKELELGIICYQGSAPSNPLLSVRPHLLKDP